MFIESFLNQYYNQKDIEKEPIDAGIKHKQASNPKLLSVTEVISGSYIPQLPRTKLPGQDDDTLH